MQTVFNNMLFRIAKKKILFAVEKRLEFCHSVFIFTQGERGAGGRLKKYRWEKRSLSCKTITQQKAEKNLFINIPVDFRSEK